MKQKGKKQRKPTAPAGLPPPTDDAVRLFATLEVVRNQVERFARRAFAGQTLQVSEPSCFSEEFRTGPTIEQLIARLVVEGKTARFIASALGLPPSVVSSALEDLACGAHIDWTPQRRGRRAVA